MIYTLTLNPAVDYYITTDKFAIGSVNRTTSEQISFGGKGINVSLVLKQFNIDSVALGFTGGFTGEALEKQLTQQGVGCDFVKVEGNTRINIKLNDTDINAAGPDISQDELERLYKKLENLCDDDFLILSGSVPKSLPQNIYSTIIERLKNNRINFVVDTEKDLLLETLKYKPFLIKPNHHELGEIFGAEIKCFNDALLYAQRLWQKGAQNVMVTLGEQGAVLIDKNGTTYTQIAPSGEPISAVGAGDSAVAAFLARHLNGGDSADCLKWAVAAGSATAFSKQLALSDKIKNIYKGL